MKMKNIEESMKQVQQDLKLTKEQAMRISFEINKCRIKSLIRYILLVLGFALFSLGGSCFVLVFKEGIFNKIFAINFLILGFFEFKKIPSLTHELIYRIKRQKQLKKLL